MLDSLSFATILCIVTSFYFFLFILDAIGAVTGDVFNEGCRMALSGL